MMADRSSPPNLLRGARVYLSGPMDFVASRAEEKQHGWRNRVGEFLRQLGVTVFDPWFKPEVRGLHDYGREGETTTDERSRWTFERSKEGAEKRAELEAQFWPAMHIDLRMVDTSDFIISYCPSNIYSVGTPHEIILARQQRKPVLFVSPHVDFPALHQLRSYLQAKGDQQGLALLGQLEGEVPIKPNPAASPSLWYMPLIGGEHFFDGFGFEAYRDHFGWARIRLDDLEDADSPQNPLLPFLERLNSELPKKWDRRLRDYAPNDDWLLWDLEASPNGGVEAGAVHQSPERKE